MKQCPICDRLYQNEYATVCLDCKKILAIGMNIEGIQCAACNRIYKHGKDICRCGHLLVCVDSVDVDSIDTTTDVESGNDENYLVKECPECGTVYNDRWVTICRCGCPLGREEVSEGDFVDGEPQKVYRRSYPPDDSDMTKTCPMCGSECHQFAVICLKCRHTFREKSGSSSGFSLVSMVRTAFKGFLEVILWIILIGYAIFGAVAAFNASDGNVLAMLGGFVGGALGGALINILLGGFIATFVELGQDMKAVRKLLEKQNENENE